MKSKRKMELSTKSTPAIIITWFDSKNAGIEKKNRNWGGGESILTRTPTNLSGRIPVIRSRERENQREKRRKVGEASKRETKKELNGITFSRREERVWRFSLPLCYDSARLKVEEENEFIANVFSKRKPMAPWMGVLSFMHIHLIFSLYIQKLEGLIFKICYFSLQRTDFLFSLYSIFWKTSFYKTL